MMVWRLEPDDARARRLPPTERRAMGCRKGQRCGKAKPGKFRCAKCGAVSGKKKRLCKPKKVT